MPNTARYFLLLSILFRRFRSTVSTILLFIFPHSPGFHFSRDDLSSHRSSLPRFPPYHYFLAVTSSVTLFSSFLTSWSSLRALQRASDSRYPLTCRRFFTRDTFHLTARAPFLLYRRTLESHKALRRIFHAAISASRDERQYSSRPIRPEKNGKNLV